MRDALRHAAQRARAGVKVKADDRNDPVLRVQVLDEDEGLLGRKKLRRCPETSRAVISCRALGPDRVLVDGARAPEMDRRPVGGERVQGISMNSRSD